MTSAAVPTGSARRIPSLRVLVTRIAGLLLSAIAVQLIVDALSAFAAGEADLAVAGHLRPSAWNLACRPAGVYFATALSAL